MIQLSKFDSSRWHSVCVCVCAQAQIVFILHHFAIYSRVTGSDSLSVFTCLYMSLIARKSNVNEEAEVPEQLVWVIEKRLCYWLHQRALNLPHKDLSTIVISCRTGKEVSRRVLQRHTVDNADGRRVFKEDASARSLKERGVGKKISECLIISVRQVGFVQYCTVITFALIMALCCRF